MGFAYLISMFCTSEAELFSKKCRLVVCVCWLFLLYYGMILLRMKILQMHRSEERMFAIIRVL